MNIYFMRRRGVPLVLSSLPGEDFGSFSTETAFRIISSGTLSEGDAAAACRTISSEGRMALRKYLQERRYIPRLLISAGAFLLAYLFFSLAVPDPIPLADELLFSFIVSAALWIILSRTDEESAFMKEKMLIIDRAIASSSVLHSSDMALIEDYYDRLCLMSVMELAEAVASGSLPGLQGLCEDWIDDFSSALLLHMRASDKGIDKTISRIESSDDRRRTARFLIYQVTIGSLDMPDLALYLAISFLT